MKTNYTKTIRTIMLLSVFMFTLPSLCLADKKHTHAITIKSTVIYPPESVGVSTELSDAITFGLVTEFEAQGVQVHDYRPLFEAMAANAQSTQPFVLTDDTKRKIVEKADARYYVDGRLFQLGNELRFNVVLRRSNGSPVISRTMVLADESDLPIAVSRLVESILTRKNVEETRTLNNATKGETRNNTNRMKLEVYNGLMFGAAVGVGDMNSHPLVTFDSRFELEQVMIQFNLGLGINGSATYGDVAIAANYYLTRGSLAPYLGVGGGVFVGDKWGESEPSDESAANFGGQFFPQVGIEFLRSAAIRVHADVRYAGNISGDRFGHGPVALVGIGF